ncbi:hypothetical protein BFW86_18625 [Pseudomonas fluorescens]|nr:hypothetical protein BFW86_18625 [Pseudomonas fluorescens]
MDFPLPHQLILFGPPGTSKSYLARNDKALQAGAVDRDIVSVTFHPDYSYGEFVARLLPLTQAKAITYDMYPGPFLRALSRAYGYWADHVEGKPVQNVVLLIDEINRGNCAEIFGDAFQLLDRADDGWSSYEISVSDLTIKALDDELERFELVRAQLPEHLQASLNDRCLKLPPNLFLIATMNTSDESVFFMDSAFKRRWNFEFCPAGFKRVPKEQAAATVTESPDRDWETVLNALNAFILAECPSRNMDDKLIGPWFIKAKPKTDKTLRITHKAKIDELATLAQGVTVSNKGRDCSNAFDTELAKFANSLEAPVRDRIFAFAQYDKAAKSNKIKAIDCDKIYFYYFSKDHKHGSGNVIETFLEGLGKLCSQASTHAVSRSDIHGKLLLFLWDSVFERDKSPLAKKLNVPVSELKTFGQFVEKADDFIGRLCDGDKAQQATVVSKTSALV